MLCVSNCNILIIILVTPTCATLQIQSLTNISVAEFQFIQYYTVESTLQNHHHHLHLFVWLLLWHLQRHMESSLRINKGIFFFAVWFSAIGEQKILFWVLHMTFVLEATVLLLRLSESCEFVHLQEKQVVGCKLRCQANPRNRMSVVAHRMWSLCDPLDQTKGLKRRQTFVCCVLFHKKSQTLLQAAQGYNPFLEKGFCGEPFLP